MRTNPQMESAIARIISRRLEKKFGDDVRESDRRADKRPGVPEPGTQARRLALRRAALKLARQRPGFQE